MRSFSVLKGENVPIYLPGAVLWLCGSGTTLGVNAQIPFVSEIVMAGQLIGPPFTNS